MTGQGVELLDAGLHVVQRDPLAGAIDVEVDLVDHSFVGGDGPVGNVDAEVALGPHHRQPEFALQDDLALRRPERGMSAEA